VRIYGEDLNTIRKIVYILGTSTLAVGILGLATLPRSDPLILTSLGLTITCGLLTIFAARYNLTFACYFACGSTTLLTTTSVFQSTDQSSVLGYAIGITLAAVLISERAVLLIGCLSITFYLLAAWISPDGGSTFNSTITGLVGIIIMVIVLLYFAHLQQRTATQAQQAEKRLLQQSVQVALMAERTRLAREMHDTVAQGFGSIMIQSKAATAMLQAQPSRIGDALARLDKIDSTARRGLQDLRRSILDLHPLPSAGDSLPHALVEEGERAANEGGMAVTVNVSPDLPTLSGPVEAGLYRITQEAINNVLKHSQATAVKISLDLDDDEVCLTILDNGCGFVPGEVVATDHSGFGLKSMEERARQIDGLFSLRSKPGEGTRMRVQVPRSLALTR